MVLTGTDFNGLAVNQVVLTDANGDFRFNNIQPGNYRVLQGRIQNGQVVKVQPAGLMDGAETFHSSLAHSGNDEGSISIVAPGGVSSLGNLFAELGLSAHFARAFDLLASSGDPSQGSGILFGLDGLSSWSLFKGSAWDNYENVRCSILSTSVVNGYKHATIRLTVHDTNLGVDRSVVLDSSTNVRVIYIEHNGTTVIRFRGQPSDLGLLAASGEGESARSSDPAAAAKDYRDAVDAVMAQINTAYA
jgi:hypothetical protein